MMRVGQAPLQKAKDGGTLGPDFGYFLNTKKCCIIAKRDKKESVKEIFKGTDINMTMEGKNH